MIIDLGLRKEKMLFWVSNVVAALVAVGLICWYVRFLQMMLTHDILIIGGGLTGLRAAVGLCDKFDVGLISKVYPVRSHSIAAQGKLTQFWRIILAGRDDTWEKHTFDTVKGSDYLGDQMQLKLCVRKRQILFTRWNTGLSFQQVSGRHYRSAVRRRRFPARHVFPPTLLVIL